MIAWPDGWPSGMPCPSCGVDVDDQVDVDTDTQEAAAQRRFAHLKDAHDAD